MPVAISRDQQIAALRERLRDRAATLSGLTPGSPSHTGLQTECDALYQEIQRLESSRSISPRLLLTVLGITALVLFSLLSGH
ncbi:hypothetical protein Kpho02_59700 [Kitasatospora phosalacinea]|uniref:Uncharacterized protein n=1 Tax=Kitasatospora phosalacinea TaxID=2065 RepID=A0A9W6QEV0_9ACTN|nr:hypothetical protein [Kitasatospora phosalacinea]GLW73671.1 hypothetical protein Kpho02_59700 [Kitasatospora phosalacinea]